MAGRASKLHTFPLLLLRFALVPLMFAATFACVSAAAGGAAATDATVRLFAWYAHEETPPLVVPVLSSETPKQAANRYLSKLRKTPALLSLFPNSSLPAFKTDRFEEITAGGYAKQVLLIANAGSDHDAKSAQVSNFSQLFKDEDGDTRTFVLPVAADLGLSENEARGFRLEVIRVFSLLTAMGGGDIDPSFYGDENRAARNVVPERDRSEIALIREYTAADTGFMLGICRGNQLTSAALGYKLIQDLPSEHGTKVNHADGYHAIDLLDTPYGYVKRAANGASRLQVITLHHQAVVYRAGGPLTQAASSDDGITEAFEFKNGRGLLLQFHPELMNDAFGHDILKEVLRAKARSVQRACTALFKPAS